GVAWPLTFSRLVVKKEAAQEKGSSDANSNDGDFGLYCSAHSLVLETDTIKTGQI
nr:P-loop containing nucleoside triphosphate hydrolases superfamily protein [Tanacetum cinerariifolium]